MKDDFSNTRASSLRAERDEPEYFRPEPGAAKPPRGLTLQIAMGIWLGGVALGLTAFLLNVLLSKVGLTPVFGL